MRELERVASGQRPAVEWAQGDAGSIARSRPHADESHGDADIAKLQIVEAVHPPVGKRAIYVSYAWGDDASDAGRQRAAVADGLCQACETEGWQVFRDKTSLGYGDRISEFMKSITRADLILVILSEKYLRSPYCMAELYGIYQRSDGDKDGFLGRVVPLTLNDAKIGTVRDRVAHADHWLGEFEAVEPSWRSLGVEDYRLYKSMKNWHNDVGDILAFINDLLHPHGFEAIVADDYKGLRTMLKARAERDSGR